MPLACELKRLDESKIHTACQAGWVPGGAEPLMDIVGKVIVDRPKSRHHTLPTQ